jgi:hypothetical protein
MGADDQMGAAAFFAVDIDHDLIIACRLDFSDFRSLQRLQLSDQSLQQKSV